MNSTTDRPIEISLAERKRRLAALCDWLVEYNLDCLCAFQRVNIVYLTGYHFQQTERPLVLVVAADGGTGLLAPDLERGHAADAPLIDQVLTYHEYPGLRHPMLFLRDLLDEFGVDATRVGADSNGYPTVWDYRGPSLPDVLEGQPPVDAAPYLMRARSIHSAEVIDLLHLSAQWDDYGHELLQKAIRPGVSEIEVGQTVSQQATAVLLRELGDRYRNADWGATPIHVGFKAGPGTAVPHPMGTSRAIAAGDVIVTWATTQMAGYHAELERTLIVGEPSPKQRFYFEHMVRAQQIGIDAMRPGRRCAEVDGAVYAYWEANDLLPYVRHHSGHGLGLEIHNAPYLDRGDDTMLEPGMVFSMEPGLYVPGLGGFRHSDTVLVTEAGNEVLTKYPRDLASLTVG